MYMYMYVVPVPGYIVIAKHLDFYYLF
jgi:hypothetical protein